MEFSEKDVKIVLYTFIKKCLLHEAIPSLFYFIFAFFLLGIRNDLLELIKKIISID